MDLFSSSILEAFLMGLSGFSLLLFTLHLYTGFSLILYVKDLGDIGLGGFLFEHLLE